MHKAHLPGCIHWSTEKPGCMSMSNIYCEVFGPLLSLPELNFMNVLTWIIRSQTLSLGHLTTGSPPASHTGFCHCIRAYLELSEAQDRLSSSPPSFSSLNDVPIHKQLSGTHQIYKTGTNISIQTKN